MQSSSFANGVLTIEVFESPEETAVQNVLMKFIEELGIDEELVQEFPNGGALEFVYADLHTNIHKNSGRYNKIWKKFPALINAILRAIGEIDPWIVKIRIEVDNQSQGATVYVSAKSI
jgi:hypothetical protein